MSNIERHIGTHVDRPRRVGSYLWKASWGPQYHPSMLIGLAGATMSIVFAFGNGFLVCEHIH